MSRTSHSKERYERSNFVDFGRSSHRQPRGEFDRPFPTAGSDLNVLRGISSVEDPILEQALETTTAGQVHELEGSVNLDTYRSHGRDNKKLKYKNRGSLQEGGEIQAQSRVSDLRIPKQKKFKQHRMVHLTQDVYIPTVVSVSQLARLLGVRLGRFVRFCRFFTGADSFM